MYGIGFIASSITLLLFSVGDTLSKKVSVALGNYKTALLIVGFGALPLLVSLVLLPLPFLDGGVFAISVAAGLMLGTGYLLVLKSLETEMAATTWTLIGIPPLFLVLFGSIFLREPTSLMQELSVAAIFLGVVLVTVTKKFTVNRMLIPAFLGNIFFAGFMILVAYGVTSHPGSYGAFYPIARVAATLALIAYGLISMRKGIKGVISLPKGDRTYMVGILCGLLDGSAQASFLFAIVSNFVALGGAIIAFEPVLVTAISHFMYGERLTRLQMAGMLLSVAGAVALSLV